jgi:hypothetical protein
VRWVRSCGDEWEQSREILFRDASEISLDYGLGTARNARG